MIVDYALKRPIFLSSVGGALDRHLGKFLNIVGDKGLYRQEETSPKKQVKTDEKEDLKKVKDRVMERSPPPVSKI